MRQPDHPAARAEAGFTLVEMLVVVAILALAAGVVLPVLARPSDGLALRTASGELVSALRATRMAAIVGGRETTLTIDVERRRFGSAAVPSRAFAADIAAKATFASAIRGGQTEGGIRFFADGSSTGGDITLALRGRQMRICVDWLTGQVRQDRDC